MVYKPTYIWGAPSCMGLSQNGGTPKMDGFQVSNGKKIHEKNDDLGVPPILGNLHMGLTWINRVYIVLYIYIMLLLSDLTTSNISAEKWN